MTDRRLPTEAEVLSWIRDRSNWGRWGADDQRGTINLITPAKRVEAARLCRTGRTVSLSRPFPKEPGINNAIPAQHFMRTMPRGRGGAAMDFYGIFYHGVASTHIDALCHTWDERAMWNGRDPKREITFDGATFGSVEHWRDGIMTRCVLLDVPRHRGVPSVTHDRPVHGWELEEILHARGLRLSPGDAVAVYSGREAWQAANPDTPYGRPFGPPLQRPGLHVSCLPFLRDHDVSLLVWDMLDHLPIGYDIAWAVHAALFAYGMPLARQRAAGASGEGLRRGGARRVHAGDRAAPGDRRHRVPREPARDLLTGGRGAAGRAPSGRIGRWRTGSPSRRRQAGRWREERGGRA